MDDDDLVKILEESFYLFKERLSDEDFKKVKSINFDKNKTGWELVARDPYLGGKFASVVLEKVQALNLLKNDKKNEFIEFIGDNYMKSEPIDLLEFKKFLKN